MFWWWFSLGCAKFLSCKLQFVRTLSVHSSLASKQASKQASEQASQPASQQASKQASSLADWQVGGRVDLVGPAPSTRLAVDLALRLSLSTCLC